MVMRGGNRVLLALLICLTLHFDSTRADPLRPTSLRFVVTVTPELAGARSFSGRLLVVLGRPDGGEPRLAIGRRV